MEFTAAILTIGIPILTGFLGFSLGSVRSFREQKHQVYRESLPTIVQMIYAEVKNEEAFNEALNRIWLYGNKRVANKVDHVAAIMIKPERGNIAEACQELIAEMRTDIQIFLWQKIEPKDIRHLYTKVVK